MYANDFLFDGQKLSDFGMIIGGVDTDGEAVVSGGEIEVVSMRPPDRDNFDYYTGKLDSPIQYNFGILKYSCEDPNDVYVTPEEESRIARWLLRKSKTQGYGWLQFDQDYYRDICYKVICTDMKPIQVIGKTVGFELTFVSNCGYGFTNEKKHRFTLVKNSNKTIVLTNDMDTYVYPKIKITGATGSFIFGNITEMAKSGSIATEFFNLSGSTTLTLDCENDIITGIDDDPTKFNWIFPRMIEGDNEFFTHSTTPMTVEISYREARRILV